MLGGGMGMRVCRLLSVLPLLLLLIPAHTAVAGSSGWAKMAFYPLGWSETFTGSNSAPETWVIGTSDGEALDDVLEIYLDGKLVGTHPSKDGVQTMFHQVPGCVPPGQHTLKFVLTETRVGFGKIWYYKLDQTPCSQVVQVGIDVKPGVNPNKINRNSRGVIPVGILSAAGFDATTVLPLSVELEGAGVAIRGGKPLAQREDIDGDGDVDLLVKVEASEFDPGPDFDEGYVTLTGLTDDGGEIEGEDYVILVPSKG
jgi:hypothetical protein